MQWLGRALQTRSGNTATGGERKSQTTDRRCSRYEAQTPTKVQLNRILVMDTRVRLKHFFPKRQRNDKHKVHITGFLRGLRGGEGAPRKHLVILSFSSRRAELWDITLSSCFITYLTDILVWTKQ